MAYSYWLKEKKNLTHIPLEQSGPRNPGKQWQVPETHSPFPWQFRGHSTTDSKEKRKKKCLLCSLSLTQGKLCHFDHFSCILKEVWMACCITEKGFVYTRSFK